MKDKITIYEKPTCSTCRSMDRLLRDSGVDFEKVNYYIEPLTKEQLAGLLRKMNMKPRDLLRTKEQVYRDLGLGEEGFVRTTNLSSS